jgi:hypothetical protein
MTPIPGTGSGRRDNCRTVAGPDAAGMVIVLPLVLQVILLGKAGLLEHSRKAGVCAGGGPSAKRDPIRSGEGHAPGNLLAVNTERQEDQEADYGARGEQDDRGDRICLDHDGLRSLAVLTALPGPAGPRPGGLPRLVGEAAVPGRLPCLYVKLVLIMFSFPGLLGPM